MTAARTAARWFLSSSVDRRVRVMAWLSLASQLLLIATGGAVRLTGSGLGCPTWPRCTPDSLTSTPEMGIHGVIEFGNRLLTVVLVIVAILTFLAVIRLWRTRRDLVVLAFLQGMAIPAQAILGGITVLTGLNPYVVGAHFIVSLALVAVTATLVHRAYRGPASTARTAPLWRRALTRATSAAMLVTVVLGVLTTGSGPHAGDPDTPRNDLDSELLQHLHSWPGYTLLTLTLALAAAAAITRTGRHGVFALLGLEVVQIVIGVTQARLGLPELLVGAHMVLSGLLVAAMVAVELQLRDVRQPDRETGDQRPSDDATREAFASA